MVKLKCKHCGHEWDYSGDAEKPTCPSCTKKTPKLSPEEFVSTSETISKIREKQAEKLGM